MGKNKHIAIPLVTVAACISNLTAAATRNTLPVAGLRFHSDSGPDVTSYSSLPENAARAAIFARVVSVMNGRSGLRPEILSFLCGILNAGVTPLLPKEGGEGLAVAKAVLGAGSCLFKGEVRYEDSNSDGTLRFVYVLPPYQVYRCNNIHL